MRRKNHQSITTESPASLAFGEGHRVNISNFNDYLFEVWSSQNDSPQVCFNVLTFFFFLLLESYFWNFFLKIQLGNWQVRTQPSQSCNIKGKWWKRAPLLLRLCWLPIHPTHFLLGVCQSPLKNRTPRFITSGKKGRGKIIARNM